jgi:hypothetical protein
MLLRALAVWLLIMVCAILNGGFRQAVLVPRLGDAAAHLVSTALLCAIILAVAFAAIRWVLPSTLSTSHAALAWQVGLFWLLLTVGFEFLAGHYLFKAPWEKLLADYNVLRGRVWVFVPVTTLLALWLAVLLRGRSAP